MIRNASPDDAAGIASLHVASWRSTYHAELPAEFLAGLDVADRAEQWRVRLGAQQTVVLVEADEGSIVGFCACGPSRDDDADPVTTWEIFALHVSPDLKGTGMGRRLFEEALRAGRTRSASTLTLWVVRTNLGARRFYERRGMVPDGATQVHTLGPSAELAEVRYRLALD
jgi:ribosomal protein S18 acetylase RimI-like enzyme